jgi:hypothetical protein
MAGEIQVGFAAGRTVYAVVRDQNARVWSNSGGVGGFETYQTANFSNYTIGMTEQGVASAFYAGNFPVNIPAGVYSVRTQVQQGGSPLETDQQVGVGNEHWNGSKMLSLADLATSGQVGQFLPMKLARGVMVQNFMFKLVSDTDNKSPFTSGVVSGQISRDGGAFGPLQSGAFVEVGLGWYSLQALTSGDLLANTAALVLTANQISGGKAAQRDFGMVLQHSSGF